MSGSIDTRVVKMELQSSAFEAGANRCIDILGKLQDSMKLDGASSGIEDVQKAVNNFDMESVEDAVDQASGRFGAFKDYVSNTFWSLVADARSFGTELLQNLTLKPIMDGFTEYQTQMGSVQTILANTKDKLKEQGFTTEEEQVGKINAALDELNTYADKTIYNFTEMTRNIGTFTAAGVDLDLATSSIKGIANLAAASGSTSQQASVAMYQLSQAISSGTVKLQDWNSVVNAGMGGELFQNALKRTARAHEVAVDSMIEKTGSFRASLSEGWLTSEILTDTLDQLAISYGEVGDEAYNTALNDLTKNKHYSEEDAKAILELAKTAENAATKVRTWGQLIDTIGEALGSGWAASWRLIVGDFISATELFTGLSDEITGLIGASQEARIGVLTEWSEMKGQLDFRNTIMNIFHAIEYPLSAIAQAFADTFGITGAQLKNITGWIADFTAKLVVSQEGAQHIYDVFRDIFTVIHSVLGVGGNFVRILVSLGTIAFNVLKPFISLAGLLVKGIAKGLAIVSEVILAVTDKLEELVGFISGKANDGITKFYELFGVVGHTLKSVLSILAGLVGLIPAAVGGIGAFVSNLAPIQFMATVFSSLGDTIKGKVVGAFDDLKKKIFGVKDETKDLGAVNEKSLTPYQKLEVRLEEIRHGVGEFAKGFVEAEDKVKYMQDSLNTFAGFAKGKFGELKESIKTAFEPFSNPRKLINGALFDRKNGVVGILQNVLGNEKGSEVFNKYFGPIAKYVFENSEAFSSWGGVLKLVKNEITNFIKKGVSKLPKPLQAVAGTVGIFVAAAKRMYDSIKQWLTGLGMFDDSLTPVQKATKLVDGLKDKVKSVISYFKTVTPEEMFGGITKGLKDFREYLKTYQPELVTVFDGLTGGIKDFISKTMQEVDNWPDFFGKVRDYLVGAFLNLPSTIHGLFEQVVNTFKYGKDNITKEAGKLSFDNVQTNFSNFIDIVRRVAETAMDFIKDIPGKIKEYFDNIIDHVADFISKLPMDKISNVAEVISKIGLGITIRNFIKSLTKLNGTIGGVGKKLLDWPKSFGDALSRFGEGFNKWRKETKADAVVKIAIAIAILAGSLFLIASLPADDLARAGKAMAIMAASIVGLMAIVALLDKFKMIDAGSLSAVGDAVQGLGIGMVGLAAAAWIFAKIPDDQMLKGVGAVFVMSLGVAAFAKALGDNGGEFKKGSAGLIFFAISVAILVKSVKALGEMDLKSLAKGTVALAVIIGALSAFGHWGAKGIADLLSSFLKFGAGVLLLTTSFIVLAAGIGALSVALSKAENLPVVLGVMASALAAFVVACMLLKDTDPVKVGEGLLMFAGAMAVLSLAFVAMSGVEWYQLLAATAALGVQLLAFGVIVNKLDSKDCMDTAKAILVFSGAIAVMSIAISVIAAMPWQGILAGTAALAALNGVLFVLTKFTDADDLMKTSTAIVIFSAAIMVMSAAFKNLEGVDIMKVVPGLVAIGVALAVLAGLGRLLGPYTVAVVALAAGFLIFSVAVLALASAFWVFTDALAKLSAMGPEEVVETFRSIGDGAGEALNAFISHLPEWIQTIINTIITEAPKLLEAGRQLVGNLLSGLGERAGELAEWASSKAGDMATAIGTVKDKFLEAGRNAVDNLLSGLGEQKENLVTAAQNMGTSIVDGLGNLGENLKTALSTAIDTMLGGIGEKVEGLFNAGAELGTNLLNGVKGFLGINSPSEEMANVGRNSGEGLMLGLDEYMDDASGKGQQLGTNLLSGFDGLPALIGQRGTDSMLALQSSIDGMSGPVQGSAQALSDNLSGSFDGFSLNATAKGNEGTTAFVNALGSGAGKAKNSVNQMTVAVLSQVNTLTPKMRAKANEAMNAFCSGISAAAGRARSAASSVSNAAASGIGSLWGRFWNVGKSAADGLAAGIYAGLGSVIAAADRLMAEAERAAKAKAQINSPSKVFIGIGESLGEGLVDGIGNSKSPVSKATAGLAGATFDSFKNSLSTMSIGLDDLLETDYNPVITPVIDPTEFDSSIGRLATRMNNLAPNDLSIGTVNYNQEFASKLSDYADVNRQAIQAVANNAIDYDILGVAVANALIRSGVHVEMDSGEFVGYLAGEISDVRRMYM